MGPLIAVAFALVICIREEWAGWLFIAAFLAGAWIESGKQTRERKARRARA